MIEISFGKLLLLALVALIVLGPEKLPGAARTAGALLRRVRGGWDSVRAEVERELELEDIRRTAREAAAHAEKAQAELDTAVREVHSANASLNRTVRLEDGRAAAADPDAQSPAAGEASGPADVQASTDAGPERGSLPYRNDAQDMHGRPPPAAEPAAHREARHGDV